MSATFQDYINTVQSGVFKQRIKIEWLRVDEAIESVLTSDILGGNLTIQRNNGIRRSISFTVQNTPDLQPSIYGVWVKKKVKLSLGVTTVNGDYFIPQGVFVLSNPSYESRPEGGTITFNGNDKFCLLNGENGYGKLQDIYLISAGVNINTGVQQILNEPTWKDSIPPLVQPSAMTFPYDVRGAYDDSVGKMLQEIAYFSARNIYYDETGRLVFWDDVADDTKGSLYDFNYINDKYSYLGSTVEYKFDQIFNVVKVIGDNSSGTIVTAVAKNTDLSSNTNVNLLGEIPFIVNNSLIKTQQDALNLANYILKRKMVLGNTVSMNCVPLYHLDVDRICSLSDPRHNFNLRRFLIDSINIDLSIGGGMSLQLLSAKETDFTIGRVSQ